MSHSSSPNGTNKVFASVVHGPMWETHMGCTWDPFGSLWATRKGYMGLDARKPVFRGMPTTKVQTSLRFCLVLSARLLFAFCNVS